MNDIGAYWFPLQVASDSRRISHLFFRKGAAFSDKVRERHMPVIVRLVGQQMMLRGLLIRERRPRDLDQDTVRIAGMDERFAPDIAAEIHVEQRNAVGVQFLYRAIDIGNLERYVMNAFTAPLEETRNEPIAERRHEFELSSAREPELRPAETLRVHLTREHETRAERLRVERDRRAHVAHSDRHMVNRCIDLQHRARKCIDARDVRFSINFATLDGTPARCLDFVRSLCVLRDEKDFKKRDFFLRE
jgi:hypothetical protein